MPTADFEKAGLDRRDLLNTQLIQRVRTLIESDFCKNRDLVSELDPNFIRFISTIEGRSEVQDFSKIKNKGDTTDEEEEARAAVEKKEAEEEKKGEPDEELKEEEKKELAPEEDKKEVEEEKDMDDKAKRKADKEAKLKDVKEKLQKMKNATIFDVWKEDAAQSKDAKTLTDEQKKKISEVKEKLDKPKMAKVFGNWKQWSSKHANDRKLTWEQTLQSTRPLNCFNDTSVKESYAEILQIFEQGQLRYVWTLIR